MSKRNFPKKLNYCYSPLSLLVAKVDPSTNSLSYQAGFHKATKDGFVKLEAS